MADGGYRDDREALRTRVEELEAMLKTSEADRRALAIKLETSGSNLPKGPAKRCRGCGAANIEQYYYNSNTIRFTEPALAHPRACSASRRLGFLFWKCREPGDHLHEHCQACGYRWLSSIASD